MGLSMTGSLRRLRSDRGRQKLFAYVIEGFVGAVIFGYIFYNSIWGLIPTAPFIVLYIKIRRERESERRKEKLLCGFKEGMNVVAVALRAGYSVENAFLEAGREMALIHKDRSEIDDFFDSVRGQLSVNRNIEEVLADYAEKSGVDDIISFSEVFTYAKRSGGNMVEIIQDTVNTISHKADTAREISVLISSKQLEQLVMDIVPVGIILYLRLTAPELICRLYGNLYGIAVMTACLMVYASAVIISLKLADIRV